VDVRNGVSVDKIFMKSAFHPTCGGKFNDLEKYFP